jgi:GTP-binding protein Era
MDEAGSGRAGGSADTQKDDRIDEATTAAADDPEDGFKSGFVTLIGRPNAGKSTLVNAVLGTKLAIISDTPQTTRHRFRAVVNTADYQLVLVDTPGIHKPHDALGEELNRSAQKALESVDAVCFVLDAAKPFGTGDQWVLNALCDLTVPRVLVLNKIDCASAEQQKAQIDAACSAARFDEVVALSALEGTGVDRFVEVAVSCLPYGPLWFPADVSCDQPLEVIVAEFIREKVLLSTFDEVPHAVGVQVEELTFDKRNARYSIHANIFVERKSQKGILIGHRGEKIKQIGTQARQDLMHFLGSSVYLELRVKLRKGWRRDAAQIRRFGYGEGG